MAAQLPKLNFSAYLLKSSWCSPACWSPMNFSCCWRRASQVQLLKSSYCTEAHLLNLYEDSPMDILSTDTCVLLSTDIYGYMIFLYLKEFLILIFHLYFYTWELFLQYSKYHNMCSLKYSNLKWILHHYIRNIPLYVFRNILLWELLNMFSARYLKYFFG